VAALLLPIGFSASAIERDGVSTSIGGFYANVDSSIGSTFINQSGKTISGKASFESDLGLEETSTQPIIKVQWNFKQKHLLSFNYFNLNRKSTTTRTSELITGKNTYKAGSVIDTKLDLEFLQLKYGYAFYQNEVSEWGVTGGLHLITFETGINGTVATDIAGGLTADVGREAGFTSSVPLPNIGTYYNYKFADNFMARFDAQYFDINVDSLDAGMIALETGIEYYPLPELSLYTGLSYYNVDAIYTQDVGERSYIDWDIKLKYWGPVIALGYNF